MHLTAKVDCDGNTDNYVWLTDPTTVTQGTWTQLEGKLDLSGCTTLDDILLYEEGAGAGVDVYVDDVFLGLQTTPETGGAPGTGGSAGTGGTPATGGSTSTGGSVSSEGGAAGQSGSAGSAGLAGTVN
jgi:hypothetical protein